VAGRADSGERAVQHQFVLSQTALAHDGADIAANYPGDEPVLVDVEGEHAALWYHLLLALPGEDVESVISRLPDETPETVISLFDYRSSTGRIFCHTSKPCSIRRMVCGWRIGARHSKKHDVFDLLDNEGFIRTATMTYTHQGSRSTPTAMIE